MFGRRAAQAPAVADDEGAYPWAVTSASAPLVGPRTPDLTGTAGWAPFGHGQHESDQVGAYTGPPLNLYPAIVPGVQRENGVSAMRSGWYYPTRSAIPNGSLQQSQQHAYQPGYQRNGSPFGGFIGPITARLMRQRQTAAAVQQTSLMAQPWAGVLQPSE